MSLKAPARKESMSDRAAIKHEKNTHKHTKFKKEQ